MISVSVGEKSTTKLRLLKMRKNVLGVARVITTATD